MLKEEFSRLLDNFGCLSRPTIEEYKLIEKVYTFYPAISETEGKAQVAYLYANFGIAIFKDMAPTAEQAEQIESDIRYTKHELSRLQDQYNNLKKGVY